MEFDYLTYFHFLRPEYLWLTIPFALVIYVNWKRTKQQKKKLDRIPEHLQKVLVEGNGHWSKNLPVKLTAFACVLAVIIISGPSWTKQASPFGEDKADLVIVLDTSSSMSQSDVAPDRLSLAKFKILDLINERDGGRTSLVVYSGSAHVAMPLTQDKQVFKSLLEGVTEDVMPREGKFAHYALPLIEKIIDSSERMTTVLFVTDALNLEAEKQVTAYFNERPHQLIVWGMGNKDNAAPIAYEYEQLKNVTNTVSGYLFTVTTDNSDVSDITSKIESQLLVSEDNVMPWLDSGYPLTFLLATIYLLWFRRGWMVKWCLIGAIGITGFTPGQVLASEATNENGWKFIDLWLTPDQQGQRLYNKGDFTAAAQTFNSPHWKAMSYYQAGDYSLARQFFLRTDSIENRFGVAAALAHSREYVAARNAFQVIVDENPEYSDAVNNLQLMKDIIAQINMQSESQSNNAERQNSRELPDEEPQTSDGADTKVTKDQIVEKTLTADEIINNDESNQMWMRRVESDIGSFLQSKFHYQLQEGVATMEINYEN